MRNGGGAGNPGPTEEARPLARRRRVPSRTSRPPDELLLACLEKNADNWPWTVDDIAARLELIGRARRGQPRPREIRGNCTRLITHLHRLMFVSAQ